MKTECVTKAPIRAQYRAESGALVLGAALLTSTAMAAPANNAGEAQARYQQDLAACNSATAYQAPETCRLEARNALTESRRGGLNDTLTAEQYRANALQRCVVHQGADRAACEARMRGEGRVDGSVGQGGLLRELVTPANAR